MMAADVRRCAPPRIGLATALLACLTFAGCGGPPSGQLSGKVTFNGEPVSGAAMAFESTTNPEVLFRGSSSADGTYHVDYRASEGMPPGPYKVTVRRQTLPGGKPLPQGEEAEGFETDGKVITTTFTFDQEVAEGANEVDFELTKGKQAAR
jgi:hypothetical protein